MPFTKNRKRNHPCLAMVYKSLAGRFTCVDYGQQQIHPNSDIENLSKCKAMSTRPENPNQIQLQPDQIAHLRDDSLTATKIASSSGDRPRKASPTLQKHTMLKISTISDSKSLKRFKLGACGLCILATTTTTLYIKKRA